MIVSCTESKNNEIVFMELYNEFVSLMARVLNNESYFQLKVSNFNWGFKSLSL